MADESRDVDEARDGAVPALIRVADRLDQLADTAELMGDDLQATRLRNEASARRHCAMGLLDR